MCRTRFSPSSPDGVAAVVVDWAAAPFLTMAGVAVLEDLRQQVGKQGIAVRERRSCMAIYSGFLVEAGAGIW
ncbi:MULTISPECIES: hypothetical protein [unclassified Streptomyces]|uniref:hypothetical protein n=1 Tax=unclassified Streptomyces TaxID=2593676 RepID=UPI0036E64625